MKFDSDIDIDLGSREKLLEVIRHTPASIRKGDSVRKHNSGVYVTEIPTDCINQMSSLDYVEAEKRGYFKLDLLNVHVYEQVKNEQHLLALMREPNWARLNEPEFVEKVIHLTNQYRNIKKMPEPIDSIPRLAMFLAAIRPAKKHLIGRKWVDVAREVWRRGNDGYTFKKSHSIGYAWLVAVHMNLVEEKEKVK